MENDNSQPQDETSTETPLEDLPQHVAERNAFEMRQAGLTYQQIADRQQVDVSTAHRRVQRVLAERRRLAATTVADVRDNDLAKLAWIERQLLIDAVSGDRPSVRLMVQIVQCRKRYLQEVPPHEGFHQMRARQEAMIDDMLQRHVRRAVPRAWWPSTESPLDPSCTQYVPPPESRAADG